jgi:hypothetical protein
VVIETNGGTVPPSLIFVGPLRLMITLTSCNRPPELSILGTKTVVFLFETLRYSLEGDVTLDLALLVELDACLKLSKLRLLAFSEGALCGSSGYTGLACCASKVPTELDTCSGRADHWHRTPRPNPFEYF